MIRAQREVLTLRVAELLAQRLGHSERDGDGVARLALDTGDLQRDGTCSSPRQNGLK